MPIRHQSRLDSSTSAEDHGLWLVVGLGNPGIKYENTRHNLGYMVVDGIIKSTEEKYKNQSLSKSGLVAQIARIRLGYGIDSPEMIVAKTGSFMNVSGPAVKELLEYYDVAPAHLLVIHDDIDLDFGVEKLKIGGSDGGHNGLKSIANAVHTRDFARLRVGVGRPPAGDVIGWVLGNFPKNQCDELEIMEQRAVRAALDIVEQGFAKAQARLHLGNSGRN